jgi:hypothetical protein
MGDFFSSFAAFVIALADKWGALVTGGFVIGALAVWERYRGKAISWSLYFPLALVLLFCAFFLIWRDQQKTITDLNQQLKNPITITFAWANVEPFLQADTGGRLWIRARADNKSANDVVCRVYLSAFGKDGDPKPLLTKGDSIELLWAGGEYEPSSHAIGDRTIPAGSGKIFNLAYIEKGANELSMQPEQAANQIGEKLSLGIYRFTIQASYSTCRSDPIVFVVKYEGGQQASFVKVN